MLAPASVLLALVWLANSALPAPVPPGSSAGLISHRSSQYGLTIDLTLCFQRSMHEVVLYRKQCRCAAGGNSELIVDVLNMVGRGTLRDNERVGDLTG